MEKIYKSIVFKVLAFLISLYTVFGFVLLPYLIQTNFTKTVKSFTSANGYMEKIYINPYTFEVEISNLLIQDDKNKTLLYFSKFSFDFKFYSLFTKRIVVDTIYLKDLKSNIILDKNKIFNFQYIIDFISKNSEIESKANSETNSSMIGLVIEDIKLLDNRVVFVDNSKSTPFELNTDKFDIKLKHISILPNGDGSLALDIDLKRMARLKIDSSVSLNPIKFVGNFELNNLRTDKIYSYIKDDIDFDFNGERINLDFKYDLAIKDNNLKLNLDDINTLIYKVQYKKDDIDIYSSALRNSIEKVRIEKGIDKLDIKLNGKLSVEDLKVKKGLGINLDKVNTDLAYNVNYKNDTLKLVIENKNLIFTDLSKQKPIKFNIKNINTRVNSITLDKTTPILYGISFDTPKKGNISVDGDVVVEPLKINSKLISEDISFEPYLPYLKEFVNIDLKSGSLSTKLNIKLEEKDDLFEPLVQGDIIVDKIDIFHSLDEQRIFSMDQLKIEDIKFKTDDLNIKNITLDGIYSKFAIASDKTTNLDNIMVANDINSSVKKDDKKSSFKYFIKNIELKNSKTDFSDFSLPLNFETKIDSLSANIKDISSNDSNTKIKLTGIVDKYGMATINGDINTANYKKRTDVKIDFENLDVTSYSPYSGKFIGNKIATGRLWLDLSYKIRDSKLSSTNNMRIKELTLGEVVQSEDAVDLPIGLVIALLEDSDGFIDVDVPVDGDIDNPEFKLSGAIWGAVGNVIKNIITSPFRFLGSLLGIDSDELGSIDFDYGLATLLPPQKEKLDNLSKALHKKHNLALRIEPFYDEVEDLKLFQKEKLVTLIDKKDKSKSIKKLYIKEFGEEEYDKLNSLNKDKNIIDILTQKLIPTIIIEKELLEKLAIKRAKVIKEYLVSKNLDTSRVIISDKINNITLKDMKRVSINLEVDIKKKEEK